MTHTKWMLPLAGLLLAFGTGCSKVPDLTGMTQAQAQAELTKDKLQTGAITYTNQPGATAGTVVDQDPKPKGKIPDNKTVALVLQAVATSGTGATAGGNTGGTPTAGGTPTTGGTPATGGTQGTANPNLVPVPNLNGQTQAGAEAVLNQIGFVPDDKPKVVLNDKPAGKVFDQDPPAGTPVPLGTTVTFSIASDAVVTMPQVIGQPQAAAEQLIKNAQLI